MFCRLFLEQSFSKNKQIKTACRQQLHNSCIPVGIHLNRPFPSSLLPLFQNECKCETFHMKMSSACSFIFTQIKVIFALRLALKPRHKGKSKMAYIAILLELPCCDSLVKKLRKKFTINCLALCQSQWSNFISKIIISWQRIVNIPNCSEFVSTYPLFPCDTADTTGSEAHSTSPVRFFLVSALKTKLCHKHSSSLAETRTVNLFKHLLDYMYIVKYTEH